jgi:hypothetical protein
VELIRFVDDLQRQLLVAAEAGGDDARALATRLLAPLESSVRLVLLDALSAAADEITSELAPGSVSVRLRGLEPELVVTPPPVERAEEPPVERAPRVDLAVPPPSAGPPAGDGDDGAMARITLRLPEPVKVQIEQAAGRAGLSVNSWLATAATKALGPEQVERRAEPPAPSGGRRVTGWAR